MDPNRHVSKSRSLSEAEMKRVIKRALELDGTQADTVAQEDVLYIARELGVSSRAISQALRESMLPTAGSPDPLLLHEAALNVAEDVMGRGWLRRVLRRGFWMGLGVGFPVGLLLAFTTPPAELPAAGRIGATLMFVGLTMLWTMPASFGVRWLSMRSLKRYTPPE